MENFIYALKAIGKDMGLFFKSILGNTVVDAFIFGIFLTVIVVGFVVTKNPKRIPVILQYSAMDGFQKLSDRDTTGTYSMSYSSYTKMHSRVRSLFMLAIVSFCVMVTTLVLKT